VNVIERKPGGLQLGISEATEAAFPGLASPEWWRRVTVRQCAMQRADDLCIGEPGCSVWADRRHQASNSVPADETGENAL
jgi:hypothetical protein